MHDAPISNFHESKLTETLYVLRLLKMAKQVRMADTVIHSFFLCC